mmetsp:Transcript_572/g.1187  ORF Transcript_572/g.1187 Transcript_572/m.1187 type:complete len:85 (-) Transcript_572:13-267(-)
MRAQQQCNGIACAAIVRAHVVRLESVRMRHGRRRHLFHVLPVLRPVPCGGRSALLCADGGRMESDMRIANDTAALLLMRSRMAF